MRTILFRLVVLSSFLSASLGFAQGFTDVVKEKGCVESFKTALAHYDRVTTTWLAVPTSAYHIGTHFKELQNSHAEAFKAIEKVLEAAKVDVTTLEDAKVKIRALDDVYRIQAKVLFNSFDQDSAFFSSLETIERGLRQHQEDITTLKETCPSLVSQLDTSFKNADSWIKQLSLMKAYISVAQKKRSNLLAIARQATEKTLQKKAHDNLAGDISKLQSELQLVLAVSDLQGNFEEWYYVVTSRLSRQIYTLKQYHEPRLLVQQSLVTAQEYVSKTQALPPLPGDIKEYLVNITQLAVTELTRIQTQLIAQGWEGTLKSQLAAVDRSSAADRRCQDLANAIKDAALTAKEDEGRATSLLFARHQRTCTGGQP